MSKLARLFRTLIEDGNSKLCMYNAVNGNAVFEHSPGTSDPTPEYVDYTLVCCANGDEFLEIRGRRFPLYIITRVELPAFDGELTEPVYVYIRW